MQNEEASGQEADMMRPVDLRIENGIAIVTLNMPERRNVLSTALVGGALDALAESGRRGARAVVITGTPPAFCAGANIADLLEAGWMEPTSEGVTPYDLFAAIEDDPRPVIAAVNGPALGGGFELTLCCDLVFAAESAFFALPELGVGVIPNTALGRLVPIAGRRIAAELVLRRQRLPAGDASRLGIVNHVCPAETLLDQATACAREIVEAAPPSAIRAAKTCLRHADTMSWSQIRNSVASVRREEWQEGLRAFLEKRRPDFDRFWQDPDRSGRS